MILLNMIDCFKEFDRHGYHVSDKFDMDIITCFKEFDRYGYHVSDAGETLKAFALLAKLLLPS